MPAGFGAMYVQPAHPVSAVTALRAVLGNRLHYTAGSDLVSAADLARHSSVAIVVVHDVESERQDRTTLALPAHEDALVSAVAAANPHTVVVLETGSAVLMPWIRAVPAVLETWYPGEVAGTSLVDLLSGRVDPSGKLPVTFPGSAGLMPAGAPTTFGGVGGRTLYSEGVNVGYRWYQARAVTPAFPFGFGLSYTSFSFSRLHITADGAGGVTVQASVTNTGRVRGADVVQCYVGIPAAGEPVRQLRGFQRLDLSPGRTQAVTLHLTRGDLAVWSTTTHSWMVPGGSYRLWLGDASDAGHLPLSATVTVAPAQLGPASGPAPIA
jgi:beta-glucosidase